MGRVLKGAKMLLTPQAYLWCVLVVLVEARAPHNEGQADFSIKIYSPFSLLKDFQIQMNLISAGSISLDITFNGEKPKVALISLKFSGQLQFQKKLEFIFALTFYFRALSAFRHKHKNICKIFHKFSVRTKLILSNALS